jgi:hypothetical protein
MSLLSGNKPKKFKNDREYTYESLIKQLNLLELHVRDGSVFECSCSSSKHMPTIEGLAEEGIGFTEDYKEKRFMQKLSDTALAFKNALKTKDKITEEEAEEIREWAREMRRRIDLALWEGDLPKSSRKDEIEGHGGTGDATPKKSQKEPEVYGRLLDEEEFREYTFTTMKRERSDPVHGKDVSFVNVSPSSARRNGLD